MAEAGTPARKGIKDVFYETRALMGRDYTVRRFAQEVLGGSVSPAALAGYPSITVPAGNVFGLPVGMSFFGRAWTEPLLLKIAYAFEQATKFRKPPQFYPTADLKVTHD
jgi:Asp-tRNA(Asn)/Glu-tRNA(Gln) amidotransferase A subunit family amidase